MKAKHAATRLPEPLYEELEKIARQKDRTKSYLIREAVSQYVLKETKQGFKSV
jgi:predicted DNA-binding protein